MSSPSELRKACLKAAERAIEYLRSQFLKEDVLDVVEVHENDVARKVDLEVEDIIIRTLRDEGFKGAIVTEEKGVIGEGPPYAVVDPLDGSLNFAVGSPYFATSIAIADGDTFDSIVAGAICPGFGHPCYSAEPGRAFAGTKELKPSSPEKVLIYYGEPEDDQFEFLKEVRRRFGKLKVRTPGAIALDMINLARGKVFAITDVRQKMRNVDLAAGYIIMKEAGVAVMEEASEFRTDTIEVVGDVLFARFERDLEILKEVYSAVLGRRLGK